MTLEDHLNQVLPQDLPHRDALINKSARHLALIEDANRHFNLTRITTPREAAIKHVLDSVMPWRLFAERQAGWHRPGSRRVLDAGTGAGFPGIPLSIVLPDIQFTLAESIQKKSRFVESALAQLHLPNVSLAPRRAEEFLRTQHFDIITARALAPISRALTLFAPALKSGAILLLYKGPEAEQEIAATAAEARNRRVRMEVVMRYPLPDDLGFRTMVEIHSIR